MKKTIATTLFLAATAASAADLSVTAVRDMNVDKNGHRVTLGVMGVNLSATQVNDSYTRYAVGKDFQLAKVAGVSLSAGGAVGYQNTERGADGYGVSVGAKSSMALTKNVSLMAGVERFTGQKRIENFDGTLATVGLTVKF